MKGLFITFEGIEGSGKTYQVSRLIRTLNMQKERIVLTREPGGTKIGDQIRKILLSSKNCGLNPITDLLLYNAARYQHISEVIVPALKRGEIVICDRFTDATLAYQSYAQGLPLKLVQGLNMVATLGLEPDLTFLLDIDPRGGLGRANRRIAKTKKGDREDRFEKKGIEFQAKVRAGYLEIAKANPKRIKVVDGSRNKNEIEREILKIFNAHLRK